MKRGWKKEYLILFGIIVAACLYLYFHETNRVNYQLPELETLEQAKINRIELSRPEQDPLVLEKEDGRWKIRPEGYPADEAQIADMLAAAADMTLTTLVSRSADYDRYGLSPESALSVRLADSDGNVRRFFAVGQKPASHNHTFVRIENDPRVYSARGRLKNVFDKTASRLRDKTVLAFNPETVKTIEICNGGQAMVLEKQPAEAESASAEEKAVPETTSARWQTEEGERGASEKIKALLETLSSLQCARFLSEEEASGLAQPVYTITLKIGKEQHVLSLFAASAEDAEEEDADYRGTSSQVTSAFVLPASRAEAVRKNPADLLAPDDED